VPCNQHHRFALGAIGGHHLAQFSLACCLP
jgi:hypothetical protein